MKAHLISSISNNNTVLPGVNMLETIEHEAQQVISDVIALLPDVFGAILLLLIGWLIARFFRLVIERLSLSLNQFLANRFIGTHFEFVRMSPALQRLLGFVVFWATMLVFIAIAVRLVGFSGAAGWLEKLVVYLPSLLAGGLIIVSGFILGASSRKLATHAAAAADINQPQNYGRIAQAVFIVSGLVIGLGQIGVDVTFLVILFGIVLAAVLAGFSLAFGLGAKSLVENLIANHHLRQMIKPGEFARIGDLHGRVLEFTATGIVLDTVLGRSLIPASICLRQSLTIEHEQHEYAEAGNGED